MLMARPHRRYQIPARTSGDLDRIVFSTESVVAAKFACAVRDPRFRDSGPANHFAVTFPRTAVWIRYAGDRSFVADPTVSTIYNPGQEYTRSPLSSDGDRCDWLGVSAEIAVAIAESMDPATADRPDRPFARRVAPVDKRLYMSQRRLFAELESTEGDPLDVEERIIRYVTSVVRSAYDIPRCSGPARSDETHRDIAERARAAIAATIGEQVTLGQLAARVGVSPFHLCRVFREQTGFTLHAYRLELRLRTALERMADPNADLSRVALDLGFSSHSHFSAMLRGRFGRTPTSVRKHLAGAAE